MKIVVALDSFKGSLDAPCACDAVRRAVSSVCSGADVVLKPMADGGEGTARAMIASRGGEWVSRQVMGPLPDRTVTAGYAWFSEAGEALVEIYQASQGLCQRYYTLHLRVLGHIALIAEKVEEAVGLAPLPQPTEE